MKKGKRGTKRKRQGAHEGEDWCFVCKDGGNLILCDYEGCQKVYHVECIGRDDSFLENGGNLNCDRHSCYICQQASTFRCFCCTKSICKSCLTVTDFAPVREEEGFCSSCLRKILVAEELEECGSNQKKRVLNDQNRDEWLFKDYWDIIKEEEGLTLETIYFAELQLEKKGMNRFRDLHTRSLHEERVKSRGFHKKPDLIAKRKKTKGLEFVGWGSKPLVEFLQSVGQDTTKEISLGEVHLIITRYIFERNLFDPKAKRKILCDKKLEAIFGKKIVCKQRIYHLLENHYADLDSSDDEGEEVEKARSSLNKKSDSSLVEKPKTLNIETKAQEKGVSICKESSFASIVPQNLKLVYLRRSLVEELTKKPESFEEKVVGSFVKVKTLAWHSISRNSYHLLPVTGVKKNSTTSEILLQVHSIPESLSISMLYDHNFTEDELEDLRENVKSGLLEKPTVVGLEEKARSLHEILTKDWIKRELRILEIRIDQANERGWRRQMFEYIEKRELLKKPSEQARLLAQVPKVIAESVVVEAASTDEELNALPPQVPNFVAQEG